MARIGLFYGSSTGHTAAVAKRIRQLLGEEEVRLHNVATAFVEELNPYASLILGTSTWGQGGLQLDWEIFVRDLGAVPLEGKKVALFGLGNSRRFPGTFMNSMGRLYQKVAERGATVVGAWPAEGYTFTGSSALLNGKFVGLALDDDNQPELTEPRVRAWVEELRNSL